MSVEVAHPASAASRSSPVVPPIDLRHMTSTTGLTDGRRVSQHLQPIVRRGSRSPSSIPSSPTSVHSSSSAIFERDIEPLHLSSSLPSAKKDPHRLPRGRTTESLEQSVPSVLDSAATALASLSPGSPASADDISVTAPAPLASAGLFEQGTIRSRSSGFASPIGSFRSRSPSPSPRAPGNRASLLLNIPLPGTTAPHQHVATPLPASQFSSPPGSASPLPTNNSNPNSGALTARQFDPVTPLGDGTYRQSQASKRLSFVAYSDLLASTPTATQPLSALTSPTNSPSHIPGVALGEAAGFGFSGGASSGAPSLRNFGFGGGDEERDRTMDDVGGEWEREGLGRGLEERLEALQGFGMT
ncbi:hypothetical protein DFH07DRAFT_909337 [Mycena maculata]|uniref:Uncharacterized protein n=1 Tax=Mycena maculata TaxID=230809 RepID=A0AAD7KDJ0_9AGAR|nr:hypothetical protein DFH07DRAFT_909337 [Mycena maculata]